MSRHLSPPEFRPTSGLSRLEELQRQGCFLFQGDRTPGPRPVIHPRIVATSFDPEHIQGWWIPEVGPAPPSPIINDIFPNARAAAMLALTQPCNGTGVFRTDEFPDGTVAFTVGETLSNQGVLDEALQRARGLGEHEPLGDY